MTKDEFKQWLIYAIELHDPVDLTTTEPPGRVQDADLLEDGSIGVHLTDGSAFFLSVDE